MQAIILAGGKGTRLKPFTTIFPKPLVPIGDVPILEVVIRQLRYYGFTEIVMAVNHLSELIMSFFGDGSKFGVSITYSVEHEFLGTAGPIAIVPNLQEDFLVMNGDLLTTINYRKLFDFHRNNGGDATISIYKKDIKIDLGVVKTNGSDFEDYIEKPTYSFDVSMGVYVFNKRIVRMIPYQARMDLPDLMLALKRNKNKIQCFRDECFWLDIGRVDDYEKAIEVFNEKKSEFLPNG